MGLPSGARFVGFVWRSASPERRTMQRSGSRAPSLRTRTIGHLFPTLKGGAKKRRASGPLICELLSRGGLARLQRVLDRSRFPDWINCEVRHVFFDGVIPGGRHQVSSKSLRIETKHDIHFRLPFDGDPLTYPGSLGK